MELRLQEVFDWKVIVIVFTILLVAATPIQKGTSQHVTVEYYSPSTVIVFECDTGVDGISSNSKSVLDKVNLTLKSKLHLVNDATCNSQNTQINSNVNFSTNVIFDVASGNFSFENISDNQYPNQIGNFREQNFSYLKSQTESNNVTYQILQDGSEIFNYSLKGEFLYNARFPFDCDDSIFYKGILSTSAGGNYSFSIFGKELNLNGDYYFLTNINKSTLQPNYFILYPVMNYDLTWIKGDSESFCSETMHFIFTEPFELVLFDNNTMTYNEINKTSDVALLKVEGNSLQIDSLPTYDIIRNYKGDFISYELFEDEKNIEIKFSTNLGCNPLSISSENLTIRYSDFFADDLRINVPIYKNSTFTIAEKEYQLNNNNTLTVSCEKSGWTVNIITAPIARIYFESDQPVVAENIELRIIDDIVYWKYSYYTFG